MLVPTGAGDPQPLPVHGIVGYHGAQWFPDGKRILFSGMEAGRGLRSYVQDVDGSPPRAVTPEKMWGLSIAPDGEWLAATGPDEAVSLWPVAGGSPRPVPGSERGERPVAWSADGRWIWLFRRGEAPAQVFKLEIATGRRQLWKTLTPSDAAGVYSITDLRITPSGDAYFYSYTQLLSQLYLVEGLE